MNTTSPWGNFNPSFPTSGASAAGRNAYLNALNMQQAQTNPMQVQQGNPWGQMPNFGGGGMDWNAWAKAQGQVLREARVPVSQYSPEDQQARAASQARLDGSWANSSQNSANWSPEQRQAHDLRNNGQGWGNMSAAQMAAPQWGLADKLSGAAPAVADPRIQWGLQHWQPPQHAADPGIPTVGFNNPNANRQQGEVAGRSPFSGFAPGFDPRVGHAPLPQSQFPLSGYQNGVSPVGSPFATGSWPQLTGGFSF